jgi:hypothetical protein
MATYGPTGVHRENRTCVRERSSSVGRATLTLPLRLQAQIPPNNFVDSMVPPSLGGLGRWRPGSTRLPAAAHTDFGQFSDFFPSVCWSPTTGPGGRPKTIKLSRTGTADHEIWFPRPNGSKQHCPHHGSFQFHRCPTSISILDLFGGPRAQPFR